jgi:DnaK suppressor protein
MNQVPGIMSTTHALDGKLWEFERELLSQRSELRARVDDHCKAVLMEKEPDDEIADAHENLSKTLLLITLEREQQSLHEIDLALKRIARGDYGFCVACGTEIPDARLRALPWTRYCVRCAGEGLPTRSADE